MQDFGVEGFRVDDSGFRGLRAARVRVLRSRVGSVRFSGRDSWVQRLAMIGLEVS